MTEFISPIGEWEPSGEKSFVWRTSLYDMEWGDIELEDLRIACAPYGGPIAATRNESKIIQISGPDMRPKVDIYTGSGRRLASMVWERQMISSLGWSTFDELIVVETTGDVTMYDQQGVQKMRQFSFGEACMQEGIQNCCIYPGGIVVLTKAGSLWSISDLEDPKPKRLASPKLSSAPRCLAVLEPEHSFSGSVEVLLATENGIAVVDQDSFRYEAKGLAIHALAVSPMAKLIAAYTDQGSLIVWSSDFTQKLIDFNTQAEQIPDQMAWCGIESVVLAWRDYLLVVDSAGETVTFELDSPVTLVQEIDGLRLVSSEKHELLRFVPQSLVDIFKIGSTEPGADLFDARTMFDQQNVKADEVLRSITQQLPEAVETCISGAAADTDLTRQKALLRAAVYGRAFCPAHSFSQRRILDTTRRLQILNAVREPSIGMPLTMEQFNIQGADVLLQRLMKANRHLLAMRIAKTLDLPVHRVLMHWACAKITAAMDTPDDELMQAILAKLKDQPRIHFTSIASHAQSLGRKQLATQLLEQEVNASQQVPLLLKLGEDSRALQKSLDSGDPDLLFLVLFHLFRVKPLPEFIMAIKAHARVQSMFLAYCATAEPELLEQICTRMGRYEDLAELRLKQSLGLTNGIDAWREGTSRRVNAVKMGETLKTLEQAANFYAQTKEHPFEAKAAGELARLRKLQAELEEETGNACFVGLSVVGTAQQSLRLGNRRAADRVVKEFHIPEKRLWWIKANTLAATKEWDNLLPLAGEKRHGAGPEALLGLVKEAGAPDLELARFIAALPDSTRKAEEFTAIKLYQEAAEVAAKSRDSDTLSKIQGLVGFTSPIGLAVSQLRDRIQGSAR